MSGHLPHSLRLIADAAGIEAALVIALQRRGSRLRIPQHCEGSVLAGLVGIDAARKIVNQLADEEFDIPMAKKPLAFWLRDQGWTVPKIAGRLGISRRTLFNWFGGKADSNQTDFFSLID